MNSGEDACTTSIAMNERQNNEPLDSFPAMGTVIGCVRINKPYTFHYAGYECAAWWEDREAVPGIYPVTLQRSYHHPRYLVGTAKIAAKVTNDYFPGLWGGVAISREPYKPKHVGEDREISEGGSLFQLIDDTGNCHHEGVRDQYINPMYWLLALEEAETELHVAMEYLVGTEASRFVHYENGTKRVRFEGSYIEFLKAAQTPGGDGKHDSKLSAVAHAGSILAQRGKEIAEIRRRLGYLAETSSMWRNLHNENTRWAREFLGGIGDLTGPIEMPSSPLRPEDVPWERVSQKNP